MTWTTSLENLWCSKITLGGNSEVLAVMKDGLYYSTDRGRTWLTNDTPVYDKSTAIRTQNGSLIVGDYYGTIERSVDGGHSWLQVFTVANGRVIDLKEVSGRIYAGVSGVGVVFSGDDGLTWTATIDGLSNLFPMRFTSSGDGSLYLGTWGSGIFRLQILTTVESLPLPISPVVEIHHNHPNPFAQHTMISYSLSRAGRIHMKIVDATGRTVATLFDGEQQDGFHGIDWNTGALPSGNYQCQITVGETTVSRMITLVR